jgi:hypothetical protein
MPLDRFLAFYIFIVNDVLCTLYEMFCRIYSAPLRSDWMRLIKFDQIITYDRE